MDTPVQAAPTLLRYGDPVLSVKHDGDGDWHFSDGVSGALARADIACLGCLVALDPSLAGLADLPRGYLAIRFARELDWERMPAPPPDDLVPFFDY
jgi:hypothetical protein